mgnify:CR=1 FL=1
MIELKHLSKTFETAGGRVDALKDVSLTIPDGDVYGIIGMSGAGKSTLVRCINMLERPTEGEVIVNGQRLDTMTPAQLRAARREITMIFQRFNLLMQRNCLDNVCFPMELSGLRGEKKWREQRALELLDIVGLKDKAKAYPAQLSGGQQQRVALARILSSEPEAVLLDEPFSALDSYLKWNLELELADLLALFGGPVLWVSHDLDECYRNCGSVCVMEDGKTGAVTGMDEMIRHPESVSAARLAGCKNFLAAVEKNGAVYLPEWGMALPVDAKGKTFTTLGIPDHAVALGDGGALRCTLCRVISGVEQDILLLRPEHCGEGAPALRVAAARKNSLRAGETVCVALDAEKLLLL